MNVLIPRPDQTSENPSARSTFPPQPVPSPWTKPSHSAAICASVIPGRITPWACSIAAAAISFASRMRSISCAVLQVRASTSAGVASTARGNASNHAFVYVVGSPTIRSEACVPSDSSRPTVPCSRARAATSSSVRTTGGRGSSARYPSTSRTSLVQAVRAASSADASTQNRVGSPSRGKTTASQPFIPQKFVRYRTLSGARATIASSPCSPIRTRTRSSLASSRAQATA